MTRSIHFLIRAVILSYLAASPVILSGCCEDGYRSSVETIERQQWIAMLASSFANTQIRLNNHTPERFKNDSTEAFAYREPNDSSITFQINGMPHVLEFDIPVIRKDPSSIYVVDINSRSVSLDAGGGRAIISIRMESNGPEFWTNCVDNFWCFAIGDREVQVDNMNIDIRLDLQVAGGRITYDRDNIGIEVSADIAVSGCQDDLFAFLCDIFIPDRESQIKSAIRDALVSQLRNNIVRTAMSAAFDFYIRNNLGIEGEITDVTISGNGGLIISKRERDPTCE